MKPFGGADSCVGLTLTNCMIRDSCVNIDCSLHQELGDAHLPFCLRKLSLLGLSDAYTGGIVTRFSYFQSYPE